MQASEIGVLKGNFGLGWEDYQQEVMALKWLLTGEEILV